MVGRVRLRCGVLPHRLTAVALDTTGGEIGRVEQWVNLPRSRAEAGLLVEDSDGAEGAKRVRLVWESMEHDRPTSVAVTLDGERLPAGADGTYPLPPSTRRSSTSSAPRSRSRATNGCTSTR